MKFKIKNLYPVNLFINKSQLKSGLKKNENNLIKLWEKNNIYKNYNKKNLFILHDGPPYANGNLHLGHIINKILKDIIIKFKILYGYKVPYILGWDCFGISIENKIKNEKNILNVYNSLTKYVNNNVESQKKLIKNLAIFSDYSNFYKTMNYKNTSEEIRLIKNFQKKNYIYKKLKPIYWCFKCKSNLSEKEINYIFKLNINIIVIFIYLDLNTVIKLFNIKKIYILGGALIWTTKPWTIISNQGLCVNGESLYVILNTIKGVFIINYQLAIKFLKNNNLKGYLLNIIKGINLNKIKFLNPIFHINKFFNRKSKIYININTITNVGTGIVHISPAYSIDDWKIFKIKKKKDKNIINIFSNTGILYNNIPVFENINFEKIDIYLLKLIKNFNIIINISKNKIKSITCNKHKILIIYKTKFQWFLKFNIKNSFIKSKIKKIKFIPKKSKIKFYKTIINRPEWNISRQRKWGCPLSFLCYKKNLFLDLKINNWLEIISNYIEIYGIKFWRIIKIKDLIGNKSIFLKKIYDILDVWFDSGTTHWHVLRSSHKNLLKFPADIYLEGEDQHRGWYQSSLITSLLLNKKLPFNNIITHGFIVDNEGKKLSKTLNNYKNSNDLTNIIEIDIIRLWVSNIIYTNNISITKNLLKQTENIYMKIKNYIKFFLCNLSDLNKKFYKKKVKIYSKFDKYILSYSNLIYKKLINFYKNYDFKNIISEIKKFLNNEIGNFYINIIKDKLYIDIINSKKRISIQIIIFYIIKILLKIIAPIMPFITEIIWKDFFLNKSIFLYKFYKYKLNNNYIKNYILLRKIYKNYNKSLIKIKKIINLQLNINIFLYINKNNYNILKKIKDNLKSIFKINNIKINLKKIFKKPIYIIKISKKKKCIRCWYKKKFFIKNICKNCFINLFKQNIIIKKPV